MHTGNNRARRSDRAAARQSDKGFFANANHENSIEYQRVVLEGNKPPKRIHGHRQIG
jgi:hypothetical protein